MRQTGIALLCLPCADPAAADVADAVEIAGVAAPRSLLVPLRAAGIAAAVIAAFLLAPRLFSRTPLGVAFGDRVSGERKALLASDEVAPDDEQVARFEVAPAETPPSSALPLAFEGDGPVEITWYHPLAGRRRLPGKSDRQFGAEREGGRPECGAGHCGVDIGNSVGEVIHAAHPGRVARIVTDPDRRGGRYVKLEHAGGYATYYFHLDRIHPELVPDIEIAAGEPLGTMGRSGIRHGQPHLHFAVSRLHADGSETFVDPEPMLRRAVLLDEAAPMPAHHPAVHGDLPASERDDTWDPAAHGTELE